MEELKAKVTEHDKYINQLSNAIEGLTKVTNSSSDKLDKVSEAITSMTVLIEKFNNLEINLTESFSRVHGRIRDIEDVHAGDGCGKLRVQDERLVGLGRSLDTLKDNLVLSNKTLHKDVEALEAEIKTMVSGNVLRWGFGGFLLSFLSFGAWIVLSIQELGHKQAEHIAKFTEALPALKERVVKLERISHVEK